MNTTTRHRLVPKLWETLPSYSRQRLVADLIAGITVGLVALPLAMAFAISSGVTPEAGIYTAIIAGVVVAALGGSQCQIAGPTGAFVVVIAGIVAKFGVPGLLTCTVMAGAMLVVMGLTGLGTAVRFIPRSVTIGFTNGIAVLIASTQIKDFFGLKVSPVPSDFVARIEALARGANTFSTAATVTALATLAIVLLWPWVSKRAPGTIVALVITTLACTLFALPIETIGTKFGGIPLGLPSISIPQFHPDLVLPLLPSACTVAMLAAIESLLSAVVADNMIGDRHKPDIELFAQGVANLVVPLFGGIPATGAIARTATNIRSGGTSPVAGIVHGLTLLVIVLAAAPLARFIPLATLAAILMVVSYRMGEWHAIPSILRLSWADRVVWAATFALTVFADLTVAVEVGMLLAALLFIHSVASTTTVGSVTDDNLGDGEPRVLTDKYIPTYCSVIRIRGPFLFGATEKLDRATTDVSKFGDIVVLKVTYMSALDGTGIHAIESLANRLLSSGRSLVICGAQQQPLELIQRSKLMMLLGKRDIQPHLDAALQRAAIIHGGFDHPEARQSA
ncbi:MAG TPA: SulP family inorganic anion transporter [Lacipirellulaceae bacterium]|nr:SulP family inorganic anion transporter [Lacipirellulaceae bacterium]